MPINLSKFGVIIVGELAIAFPSPPSWTRRSIQYRGGEERKEEGKKTPKRKEKKGVVDRWMGV